MQVHHFFFLPFLSLILSHPGLLLPKVRPAVIKHPVLEHRHLTAARRRKVHRRGWEVPPESRFRRCTHWLEGHPSRQVALRRRPGVHLGVGAAAPFAAVPVRRRGGVALQHLFGHLQPPVTLMDFCHKMSHAPVDKRRDTCTWLTSMGKKGRYSDDRIIWQVATSYSINY